MRLKDVKTLTLHGMATIFVIPEANGDVALLCEINGQRQTVLDVKDKPKKFKKIDSACTYLEKHGVMNYTIERENVT